jgi:hypothetical protein
MQKEKVVFVPVEASISVPAQYTIVHVEYFDDSERTYEEYCEEQEKLYGAFCHGIAAHKATLQPLPDKYILSEDELRKVKEDAWDAAIRSAQYEINPLPGTLIPPHKQEYLSSLK